MKHYMTNQRRRIRRHPGRVLLASCIVQFDLTLVNRLGNCISAVWLVQLFGFLKISCCLLE